jgi:hypothetical protein
MGRMARAVADLPGPLTPAPPLPGCYHHALYMVAALTQDAPHALHFWPRPAAARTSTDIHHAIRAAKDAASPAHNHPLEVVVR